MTLARIRSRLVHRARALRTPSRDDRGFGLVESIISVGIAGGGLLAVAGLMAAGARLQSQSRDGGRAGMVAIQYLERLRILPHNDLRVQPGGSLDGNVGNYTDLVDAPPAGQVRVRWLVQATGPAGTFEITVRAFPAIQGARASEARSLVWRP